MNKQTIMTQVILLMILAVALTFLVINYEAPEEKTEIKQIEDPKMEIVKIQSLVGQREFTLNMNGNMKHGDFITISGTVPDPNSPVTGMIIHNKDQINATIVQVFQLTSDDEGKYTYNARINDEYLWKQDGIYTISVQNEGKYKEIQFHRNW